MQKPLMVFILPVLMSMVVISRDAVACRCAPQPEDDEGATGADDVDVVFSGYAAAGAESTADGAVRSAWLVRAEKSVNEGWLRKFDDAQHLDFGVIARQFFEARSRLSPELLVKARLLKNRKHP